MSKEFIARSDDDLFMTRISLKITGKLYEERYYRDIFLLRDTRPLIVDMNGIMTFFLVKGRE